jgi:ABC-type uncharacterized transport system fused permease/ATPase subunit
MKKNIDPIMKCFHVIFYFNISYVILNNYIYVGYIQGFFFSFFNIKIGKFLPENRNFNQFSTRKTLFNISQKNCQKVTKIVPKNH